MPNLSQAKWWQDAVIYQVYPRSFRDSNGDGIGDIQGVIQSLPYLAALGVDAIWLSPFYKTPNKDGGYDVEDPRDVDPMFGTLGDAEKLISSAHGLDLKVIFDVVPNHFSSEHKWFKEALRSAPGSKERSRFHFYDGKGIDGNVPPNNWNSLFNGPAWTRVLEQNGDLGQWYLHLFDSSQPDLNWENPEVLEDFKTTLRFWLDRGVDGFRIDVAHGLAKEDIDVDHRNPDALIRALRVESSDLTKEERISLLTDIPFFDRDGVHEIYSEWRKVIDEYSGDRMFVAEAYIYPTSRLARYVRTGELHQVFNFDFLLIDWDAAAIREAIVRVLSELEEVGAPPTWALDSHDSPRVVTRLKSEKKARALAMVAHALPGSLYIYQGEELGLPDGEIAPEFRQDPAFIRSGGKDLGRDGARVPLPWEADEKNFGFSTGTSWLPQDPSYKNYSINLEEANQASFLNLYKTSLALRKKHLGLGGDSEVEWPDSPKGVVYFKRSGGFILLANTTAESLEVNIKLAATIILQSAEGASIAGSIVKIPADTTLWLQQ
ncbi:MAG: glycoside hydrolase family 13 protein [Actinomycetes bacterium]